jgi:hypothetical protein
MATPDGSSHRLMFADHRFERWPEIVDGIDYWARHGWVFRGQERAGIGAYEQAWSANSDQAHLMWSGTSCGGSFVWHRLT